MDWGKNPFGQLGLFRKANQEAEQRFYLRERVRLDHLLAYQGTIEESTEDEVPPCVEPVPLSPPTGLKQLRFCTPDDANEQLASEQRDSSEDNMPLRFTGKRMADRRNALGRTAHRKSLVQGLLSVAGGGEKPPSSELKQGKQLPEHLGSDDEEYVFPACVQKPLRDPDEYYLNKTYIMVNKQGTIFRFSKAKSLFLLESTSRLRKSACNLSIKPMFGHFIMFVIICNCACMVVAEPPKWIDEYLEYVFTCIYIAEAAVKIIARGFVLHQFSYLRDPWNWLDFTVIMAAIITQILKAVARHDFGQLAVLRAFRVLRALKTMSVIPDLRAIVKALLHSIRALKDAVVLTVFSVSVFALVGYQLFHGTLRQKCVRIPGTLDLPPDAMYLSFAEKSNFFAGENASRFPVEFLHQDFRTTQMPGNASDNATATLSPIFMPLYRTASALHADPKCHERRKLPQANGVDWSADDVELLESILNATANVTISNRTVSNRTLNDKDRVGQCFHSGTTHMRTSENSSLLRYSEMMNSGGARNVSTTAIPSHLLGGNATKMSVSVHFYVANVECMDNATKEWKADFEPWSNTNTTNMSSSFTLQFDDLATGDFESKTWSHWRRKVSRWDARHYVIIFQLRTLQSDDATLPYFVYLSEKKDLGKGRKEWDNDTNNYCMAEPSTGAFYYPQSSNRPPAEPIYCPLDEDGVCPIGYGCVSAGPNPDFGYTSFDHFFLAFLTSFRLVALDAWGRLYYLTLHTVGKTYSLFYVVVVLLGSYYLVNLILAVVYMSYEEQHMAVEVEELEAQEREAEKMEEQIEEELASIRCDNDDMQSSDSDAERGCRRVGLITTSLTSHDRASVIDGTSSPLLYLDSIRRRRMQLRRRSMMMSSRGSIYPTSDEDDLRSWPRSSFTRRQSMRERLRSASHSPHPESSDCSCDDLRSSFLLHRGKACRRRRRTRMKSASSHPASPVEDRRKLRDKTISPSFHFTVTSEDGKKAGTSDSTKEPVSENQSPRSPLSDKKFLSVDASGRKSGSLFGDSASDSCSCQSASEKCPCSICNSTLQVPFVLPSRRLSETSSVCDDEAIYSQTVQADVSHSPLITDNGTCVNSVCHIDPTICSSVNGHTTPLLNNNINEVIESDQKNPPSYANCIRTNETQLASQLLPSYSEVRSTSNEISAKSPVSSRSTSTVNGETLAVPSQLTLYQDDDEEITLMPERRARRRTSLYKEVLAKKSRRFWQLFIRNFAKWKCCPAGWEKFRRSLENVVLNPFADLLITLCIGLNTFFMCIEHHPMEENFEKMLENANLFFTIVFTVEMILKIIGLTPYTYFRQKWNVFDAVVVLFSCLEILLNTTQGLSVLRAFRLMRIMKLAKQWPTLNKLLRTIGKSVGKLWHLTIVFILVMFIFALIGMQLLRRDYIDYYKDNQPRWNFVDFPHSVMLVFRIQCGEWVENMINCLNVASPGICIPLFMLVYIIGNLVILNLFLALLLNSFSGDVLQQAPSERNSISEALRHVVDWGRRARKRISQFSINSYCCRLVKLGVRSSPKKIISLPGIVEMKSLENGTRNGKLRTATSSTAIDVTSDAGDEPIETDRLIATNVTSNGEAIHNSDVPAASADEQGDLPAAGKRRSHKHHHHRYSSHNHQHRCSKHQQSAGNGTAGTERFSRRRRRRSHTHNGACEPITTGGDSVNSKPEIKGQTRLRRHSSRRRSSVSSAPRPRRVNSICVADDTISEEKRSVSPGWQKVRDAVHNKAQIVSLASLDPMEESKKREKEKDDEKKEEQKEEEEKEEVVEEKKGVLQPCLPFCTREPLEKGKWFKLRSFVHTVVVHRHFDNVVIFCILLSSVSLAFEDVYIDKKPTMKKFVHIVDVFCCVFFAMEMLMKWLGHGLKYYFTNAWCVLDFVIVLISILNLTLVSSSQGNLSALRVLRTFRALRPLRALSRFQGMKIVVDALIRAVPSIGHVFMVCIMFWLIFSILGVHLFAGRFGRCVALPTGDILPRRFAPNDTIPENLSTNFSNKTLVELCSPNNTRLFEYLKADRRQSLLDINPREVLPAVRDRAECIECAAMLNTTDINWQIPGVNFDSALRGYLVLMQVATFNGWIEIMESATDVTGIEEQPYYEASFYSYVYFCVFIVFGAFFSLNLFIGVIIDNFNQQKIKSQDGEDGVFLTDEQRRYYNAMKQMASQTPKKPIPRPQNRISNKAYDIVTSRKFEMTVMVFIIFNMVVMAVEHHDMSEEMSGYLQYLNLGFITAFVIEAALKLIGLRFYYFTIPWNIFDFIVIVVSLIATGFNDVMAQYFFQPTLFRIIRLFRVTRVLRLIREAKGIRTLLFALMMSLPALFNIGCLLFLFMFIYAIIGMSQFPHVQKLAGIDDMLNFETFPNAFLVLFQVSTSESWDRFIEPILRDKEPYCDNHFDDPDIPSNCGNSVLGVIYFVTYVMITFLIVVNMYIAIILENFVVATRESAEPLTADDFEQFFEVWQRYDDRLSQYISYEQLKHLLHHLDYPLRVPMPNGAFIAQSKMRVTREGQVHCLEVIIALIKRVLGDSPELNTLKDAMFESFMLKCKIKESLETKDTMDSGEFTLLLRATLTIQRIFREKRSRKSEAERDDYGYSSSSHGDDDDSSNDWSSHDDDDACGHNSDCQNGSSSSVSVQSSHSSRCSARKDDSPKS